MCLKQQLTEPYYWTDILTSDPQYSPFVPLGCTRVGTRRIANWGRSGISNAVKGRLSGSSSGLDPWTTPRHQCRLRGSVQAREKQSSSDNHPSGRVIWDPCQTFSRAKHDSLKVEHGFESRLGAAESCHQSRSGLIFRLPPRYLSVPAAPPLARCLMPRIVHDRRTGRRRKRLRLRGKQWCDWLNRSISRTRRWSEVSQLRNPSRQRPTAAPVSLSGTPDHEVLLGRMRVDAGRRSRDTMAEDKTGVFPGAARMTSTGSARQARRSSSSARHSHRRGQDSARLSTGTVVSLTTSGGPQMIEG